MSAEALNVCAAVVLRGDRLLLASRRPGSHLEGKWEFPGGKIRPGESEETCIARELGEELGLHPAAATPMFVLCHDYPEKSINLHFMLCTVVEGVEPVPAEGQHAGWFSAEEAVALDLAPADARVIELLRQSTPERPAPELTQFRPEATAPLLQFFQCCDSTHPTRMPEWLHIPFVGGRERGEIRSLIVEGGLHTVCESAKCPNRCDCWKRKTATFMILGGTCTRFCRFCSVDHGKPAPPDLEEPAKIARSVATLGLRYVVITCVTRDDLADGGAFQMAASVRAVNALPGSPKVEVLCSDYGGDFGCVDAVLEAKPVVYGHNLETVERLTPAIRNRANYRRSLAVLNHAAEAARGTGILVKSGIMLGLGETAEEIRQTLADLRDNGVAMVTMGQYLRPTRRNWPVSRLVTPREFSEWEKIAKEEFGLRAVCGPLVRSSYMAEEAYQATSTSKA